jgi:hypothetical protein
MVLNDDLSRLLWKMVSNTESASGRLLWKRVLP